MWWAGQSRALVTEVLTCKQVVDRIMAGAEELIGSGLSLDRRLNQALTGLESLDSHRSGKRRAVRPGFARLAQPETGWHDRRRAKTQRHDGAPRSAQTRRCDAPSGTSASRHRKTFCGGCLDVGTSP